MSQSHEGFRGSIAELLGYYLRKILSGRSYNRTFKVRYNGNRTCFKRFMKCDEEKTATILVIWKVSEKV